MPGSRDKRPNLTPKYLQVTSIHTDGIFSMSSEIDRWCTKTVGCSPDADLAFLKSGVVLARVREFIGLVSFTQFVTDGLDELAVGRSSDADLLFLTSGVMPLTSVEGVFGPASSTQFVTCSSSVIRVIAFEKSVKE